MRGARAGERGWQGQELRDPSRPPPAERPCLRCRQPFLSDGPGNRMCGPCKTKLADASPYAV